MTDLTAAIQAAAPHVDAAMWAAALDGPATSSGIVTPKRIAAFVGQLAVESGGFDQLVESLNYSAQRMCEVWPSHFPSLAAATPYAFAPEALANAVYANRLGNGDEASGDGWAFRGRGLIQLTGRANYTAFAAAMKRALADATDWVATPEGAAAAACWFWSTHKLNGFADGWNLAAITRLINGGDMGMQQRIDLSNVALRALQPEPATQTVPMWNVPAAAAPETTADTLNDQELAKDTT